MTSFRKRAGPGNPYIHDNPTNLAVLQLPFGATPVSRLARNERYIVRWILTVAAWWVVDKHKYWCHLRSVLTHMKDHL